MELYRDIKGGINMISLKEDFNVKGSELDDFVTAVNEMTAATKSIKVYSHEMEILSRCTIDSCQKEDGIAVFNFNISNLKDIENGNKFRINLIKSSKFPPEIEEEIEDETCTLFSVLNNDVYIMSPSALSHIIRLSGISGRKLLENNIFRDMYLINIFYEYPKRLKVIYREVNKVRKMFALLGSNYSEIRQSILLDIFKSLDSYAPEMYEWKITHDYTMMHIEFPLLQREGLIPGVKIITSDIGKSSFSVILTLRYRNSIIIMDELNILHKYNTTESSVFEETIAYISENIPVITENCSNIHHLKDNVLYDGNTDISSLCNYVSSCINKVYGDILTKNISELLNVSITEDLDSSKSYTEYDIVMMLIEALETIKPITEKVRYKNFQRATKKLLI